MSSLRPLSSRLTARTASARPLEAHRAVKFDVPGSDQHLPAADTFDRLPFPVRALAYRRGPAVAHDDRAGHRDGRRGSPPRCRATCCKNSHSLVVTENRRPHARHSSEKGPEATTRSMGCRGSMACALRRRRL